VALKQHSIEEGVCGAQSARQFAKLASFSAAPLHSSALLSSDVSRTVASAAHLSDASGGAGREAQRLTALPGGTAAKGPAPVSGQRTRTRRPRLSLAACRPPSAGMAIASASRSTSRSESALAAGRGVTSTTSLSPGAAQLTCRSALRPVEALRP